MRQHSQVTVALTRTAAAAAGLLRLLFSSTEARVFMALRLQVDQPAGHRIAILSLRVKPCWVVLCEFRWLRAAVTNGNSHFRPVARL